jgi:hypothetical protein
VLRSTVMEAQAAFGDTAVIDLAHTTFASNAGTPAERRTALSIVAAYADEATFDSLLEKARKTKDPLEKQHAYAALAGVIDPELARRIADIALSDEVPAGGAGLQLLAVLSRKHPDMVWKVVEPRLDDPKLPFVKLERWELASDVAARSADPQRIADLEAYESRSVPVEARKPFLAAEASVRLNQRFVSNVLPQLDAWIQAHGASH